MRKSINYIILCDNKESSEIIVNALCEKRSKLSGFMNFCTMALCDVILASMGILYVRAIKKDLEKDRTD